MRTYRYMEQFSFGMEGESNFMHIYTFVLRSVFIIIILAHKALWNVLLG